MPGDKLDQFIIDYCLADSYRRFVGHAETYRIVEKRELEPLAPIPGIQYKPHNVFAVIFVEDTRQSDFKKDM